MKKVLSAGIVCALLMLSSSVQAFACDECYCGFYGQVFGGANYLTDSDLEFRPTGVAVAHDDEFSHDFGWGIGAAVGHQWTGGWASEFEISYRNNDIDEHKDAAATLPASGCVDAWAFMVNGYHRYYGDCWDFVPYLGLGVGAARISLDNTSPADAIIDDEDTVFAYQAIVGVSYCVCECWDLFLEYRYLGTSNPEFRNSDYKIESEYCSHLVDVGFRFAVE